MCACKIEFLTKRKAQNEFLLKNIHHENKNALFTLSLLLLLNFHMKNFFFLAFVLLGQLLSSQTKPAPALPEKPKLIVGIVVDQMRWDFLYRYSEKFSASGFKRMLREGLSCENTHINYSPSYTACGHACIYTGSVPSVHGITGNNWFDEEENAYVYCTQDSTMHTIGSNSLAGKMSPRRMLVTTVTDELRLATNFQSKTIGIAIKDRGAILPAGHTANAAYFYDPSVGNWITSSYYGMKELPFWVKQFNDLKLPEKYLSDNWKTLQPVEKYTESTDDDEVFESPFEGEAKPVFEHKVHDLYNPAFKILAATPFGNSFTLDFAEGAILNEHLGEDNIPDFLAVSLSSTDYIGHKFGPNSVEIEDCYLRLDIDLGNFFLFLDEHIGKGNYLAFLTADHGVAHVPAYLDSVKIPAGVFPLDTVLKQLEAKLVSKYGAGEWLLAYENMQLYFNNKLMEEKGVNRSEFKTLIKNILLQFEGVADVYDLENMANENIDAGLKQAISNGVFPERSGDLYVMYEPHWFEGYSKGTTHGSIYPYDTHIPLVWFGWKVKHGEDFSDVHMTDIAPTISSLLHIQEPSGNVGKVIQSVIHP